MMRHVFITALLFLRLESEVLRLRKLDTPKPPYQMLTDSEHAIMSDHNQQLEMQVESLEAQLQFVKNSKRVNEEKLQKRAEKLAEKVANLNSLLEQVLKVQMQSCRKS